MLVDLIESSIKKFLIDVVLLLDLLQKSNGCMDIRPFILLETQTSLNELQVFSFQAAPNFRLPSMQTIKDLLRIS